MARADISPPS